MMRATKNSTVRQTLRRLVHLAALSAAIVMPIGCGSPATQLVVAIHLDPSTVWPSYNRYRVTVNGSDVYTWQRTDFAPDQRGWEQQLVFGQDVEGMPASFSLEVFADNQRLLTKTLAFDADRAVVVPLDIGPQCTPLAICSPLTTDVALLPDWDSSCPYMQGLCATGCVNVNASAEHCGACDNACAAGQTCSYGTCVP